MKIAIDVSPLHSTRSEQHKVRGSGFYIQHLTDALQKYFPEHEYVLFTGDTVLPSDIDLIHYPYFEPFFLTLPLLKKKKTVVTVHDLTPLVFPKLFPAGLKGQAKWQIQRRALQSATVITDSQSSKKDIIRLAHIKDENIHVISLAADEAFTRIKNYELRIMEVRKKYHLPEKFVLYVGDATNNKNLPALLKAVEEINVPLVLVGKALSSEVADRTNPWNRDLIEVQKLTKENKSITVLGFVSTEELVLLYNIATVFVMPSLYEGFGLPVLEAMNCGCPVVTTKNGSLAEVAGEAALFTESSAHDIGVHIKEVFENRKLQQDLSENGLRHAKEFSWKKTAQETLTAYEKTLTTNN